MKTHKDLEVWKNSINLVTEVYQATSDYPKSELYSLVSQIRRSAVSIPSNIAEGSARSHNREYIQYLSIALGSLSELETQLIISENLQFIPNELFNHLNNKMIIIRSQISGLVKYLNSKSQSSI